MVGFQLHLQTPPREGIQDASWPDSRPTSSPLKAEEQRLYFEPLPDVCAPHHISQPPCRVSLFQLLVFATLFFRSLPTVLDHRWGLGHRWIVKSRASPYGSALSSPQRTGTALALLLTPPWSACPSHTSFSPHSWTRPKIQYLNSSSWSSSSSPNCKD